MQQSLPIARSSRELGLLPVPANRRVLITGATGTGKTVTLQLVERFSAIGSEVGRRIIRGLPGSILGGGSPR
jgi:predicted ATPase